jgi:hypothetical protein
MTAKVAISRTRTFVADDAGMPVSRQLALADRQEPQQRRDEPSEEALLVYLLATGVEPIEHKPPETLADAYLGATGVPAIGSPATQAEKPAEATESNDPLGDAWLAATTSGFA